MKKSKILFVALSALTLSACGGTSTPEKKDDIVVLQEIVDSLKNNNFTVEYNLKGIESTFKAYRNSNYFFDTYNNSGYAVLEDNTVYKFETYENLALLEMPHIGTKDKEFDTKFEAPVFKVADNFVNENGLYVTENIDILNNFAHLTNSVVSNGNITYIQSVGMFLNEGVLNFTYRDTKDQMVLTGKIFDINKTNYEPIKNYLDKKSSPEIDQSENTELSTLFGEGSFQAKAQVRTTKSKENFNFIIGKNYFYTYGNDIANGDGTILLSDGFAHQFYVKNNNILVGFEHDGSALDYQLTFGLGRVDYKKFYKSGNHYFSKDYFNRKSFADYFGITSYLPETVQITTSDTEKAAEIKLYLDNAVKTTIKLTNINSVEFAPCDTYLKAGTLPKLESNPTSAKLVEATKNLSNNYTITSLDKDSLNPVIKQNEIVRKESWPNAYFYDRSANYVKIADSYYEYFLNGTEVDLIPTSKKSLNEYKENFDFSTIDFSTFEYLGDADGRYFTDSFYYANVLSNISNISSAYNPTKAYIKIIPEGIEVEVFGIYSSGEYREAYKVTDIGTTVTDIDEYASKLTLENVKVGDKAKLKTAYEKLASLSNYTVKYYVEDEKGVVTSTDDDFYTKDVYYNSFYKDGIYKTKSNYFYQFYENYKDSETEQVSYHVVNEPSNYFDMSEITPFDKLTNENYDLYKQVGNKYTCYDVNEIFRISRSFNYTSYINKMDVTLNEDGTILFEFLSREYEQTNTNYHYSLFYKVLIHSVGTTVIPSTAKLPTWLK